ncbi:MAG: cytochrome c [Bacteroidota bacterium]
MYRLFAILLFTVTFACSEPSYRQGEYLYQANCSSCHMDDGSGLGKNIPTLVASESIAAQRLQLPCIIRKGINAHQIDDQDDYQGAMPAFPKLTEAEVTNIISYLLSEWNKDVPLLNAKEVKEALETCP